MYQGKQHTVSLQAGTDAAHRLEQLQRALIQQHVPSGHELFLQAPGYPELPIGRWGQEQCGVEDILLATSILIKW